MRPRAPGISAKLLGLARKGDRAAVEKLIEARRELLNRKCEGHNRTLLWEAVRGNRVELVRWLLERGADVNIPGRVRSESLVLLKPYAVARALKWAPLAEILLQAGTEIDLYTAAYLGDIARVEKLLDADPAALDREQESDELWRVTPLHHALAGRQTTTVALLLERGADVRGHSALALEIAARRRSWDEVLRLLEFGADASLMSPMSASDVPEIVAKALSAHGLDPNLGHGGWPPIVHSSRGDKGEHPERIEALIAAGADVHARGPGGRTALHAAAKAGFTSVIEVLLGSGVELNARMDDGSTALKLARRAKRAAAIAALEAAGGEE